MSAASNNSSSRTPRTDSRRSTEGLTLQQKAEICGLKGSESAKAIGLRFGKSKDAVIGIWNRNKNLCRPGTEKLPSGPQKRIPPPVMNFEPEKAARDPAPPKRQAKPSLSEASPTATEPAQTAVKAESPRRAPWFGTPSPTAVLTDMNGGARAVFENQERRQCHWPIGDDPKHDCSRFKYCGEPAVIAPTGRHQPLPPYCLHHLKASRQPAAAQRQALDSKVLA